MKKSIRQNKDYEWFGTWYVRNINENVKRKKVELVISRSCSFEKKMNKPLSECIRMKRDHFLKGPRYKIFNVCIFYNMNSVHYVAFLYDQKKKELVSFDPGVELYLHGMKTIVPQLRNLFYESKLIRDPFLSQDRFTLGRCQTYTFKGKKYGIQFNGKDIDFPADAFCQTWTLFFFHRLLESDNNYKFLTDWCKLKPGHRVGFLLNLFIIPILKSNLFVKKKYFQEFYQDADQVQVFKCLHNYTTQQLK